MGNLRRTLQRGGSPHNWLIGGDLNIQDITGYLPVPAGHGRREGRGEEHAERAMSVLELFNGERLQIITPTEDSAAFFSDIRGFQGRILDDAFVVAHISRRDK